MVFGTMTVLWAASLIRPTALEAQAIGTMQVVARVTPAEAAWQGLAAAQEAARELAVSSPLGSARRTDHPLSQIELTSFPPSLPVSITIQHLRN